MSIKIPYTDKAICMSYRNGKKCRNIWMAICPQGLDKEVCLECPKCHEQQGIWLDWYLRNKNNPCEETNGLSHAYSTGNIQILGNIYENPELLDEVKK